jgi:hypothetical protein
MVDGIVTVNKKVPHEFRQESKSCTSQHIQFAGQLLQPFTTAPCTATSNMNVWPLWAFFIQRCENHIVVNSRCILGVGAPSNTGHLAGPAL